MKILLLGATGQLGWELQRALQPLGDVVPCTRSPASSHTRCVDLARPENLTPLLDELQPQLIVNAAAYTAVDRAESEPALAHAVNACAPGVLADWAATHQATLVHYSTDYVFDGSGQRPWQEDDATAPLNVYGASKLAGEQAVRASGCPHLLLRTSWVYGARGANFARTMLRLASERDSLRVVDDQIGAPTGADLLADVTAHALRALRADPALSGTYHCAAAGHTSWHGYARFVLDWAHEHGLPLRARSEDVEPVPSSAYPTPAQRPLNSRLDTNRLRETVGLHLPTWQQGVARMLSVALIELKANLREAST